MSSHQLNSETIISSSVTPVNTSEINQEAYTESNQPKSNTPEGEQNQDQGDGDCVIKNKRQKTSTVWNDFEEVKVVGNKMKAMCKYCKEKLSSGKGSIISHLRRHATSYIQRRLKLVTQKKQPAIPFQPKAGNPFSVPGISYSNEKMREIIATAIMIHEHPFSIVENDVWMWAFQYANSDFQKVGRKTIKNDCLAIYEAEKKILKAMLKNVSKICLTTDMWRSSHQVAEYMVITGHFIDVGWKLQKRVLSFVKVPVPRRGIDVADAIFKCLKTWGIKNKVFLVSVDNASYNDSCLRNLKDNLSLSTKLVLGGKLFHVRCCAHILNLLVQDGLSKIRDIIYNIRESVKYISHNDSRLKVFCDIVEQKHLKERKLAIDCPTRWNSTFQMLSCALKFKMVFLSYKEREPHYSYAPSDEEWNKVEKVCKLLEVFNLATHIISESEYPTSNLYLAEVWRVKRVIDNAVEEEDLFMKEMATPMKIKFDKYWGECNLLMSIASVLDPRFKFHIIDICFSLIYKSEEAAKDNARKVRTPLEDLYNEYVAYNNQGSSPNPTHLSSNNSSNSSMPNSLCATGFDHILSLLREKEATPTVKSELDAYLEESIYIPDGDGKSFCALEWWRNNVTKYKILSKIAADILAVPVSTVASESTFSAGGRVIDEYCSRLNEESIVALICGRDWLRHMYNLHKKQKVFEQEDIYLKI